LAAFSGRPIARPYVATTTPVDSALDLDDVPDMFIKSRRFLWPSTSSCPPPPVRSARVR
jgi:hypothetical protein